MSVFSDLVDEVYDITLRPNLVSQTKSAVRAATLTAHHLDYFPKDMFETGLQFTTPDYVQSLDYKAVVPNWRAFKYLRKYDNTVEVGQDLTPKFFELITPEVALDGYGLVRNNTCYLAGETLEIRSTTKDTYMLLGCYVHPNVVEATYSSWIAAEYPYAIIYGAAAIIFSQIGYEEQAGNLQQLANLQYNQLLQQIVARGD